MTKIFMLHSAYAESKNILDQLREEYIADYNAYIDSEGNIVSTCTWTKGVETVFPHANYICLVDLDTNKILPFIPQQEFLKLDGVKVNRLPLDIIQPPLSIVYYVGVSYPDLDLIEKIFHK